MTLSSLCCSLRMHRHLFLTHCGNITDVRTINASTPLCNLFQKQSTTTAKWHSHQHQETI